MRAVPFLISIALTSAIAGTAIPDDKPLPAPKGVVIDLRGPPEQGNFKLDYLITLEGEKQPTRHTVGCGGWDPMGVEGEIVFWSNDGFVVEKVSETQVRFVGKKGKDGKLVPVAGLKFESKDLTPKQLPTIVIDPSTKA